MFYWEVPAFDYAVPGFDWKAPVFDWEAPGLIGRFALVHDGQVAARARAARLRAGRGGLAGAARGLQTDRIALQTARGRVVPLSRPGWGMGRSPSQWAGDTFNQMRFRFGCSRGAA